MDEFSRHTEVDDIFDYYIKVSCWLYFKLIFKICLGFKLSSAVSYCIFRPSLARLFDVIKN